MIVLDPLPAPYTRIFALSYAGERLAMLSAIFEVNTEASVGHGLRR